jgi:predicted nicotinamide N-methyase
MCAGIGHMFKPIGERTETMAEATLQRAARDSDAPRDLAGFIRANMRLLPAPFVPEILLYAAHPASGLARLVDPGETGTDRPPYWAYHWAGGAALARFILDRPQTVRGLRVLDLGSGSGIVGIAAAKAGAKQVTATDVDCNAMAAIALNAKANGVEITAIMTDFTAAQPPAIDLVLVGDLFYEQALAGRVGAFLDRCLAAQVKILVGDPGRAFLPHAQLRVLAQYPAPDFGDVKDEAMKLSAVFSYEPRSAGRNLV